MTSSTNTKKSEPTWSYYGENTVAKPIHNLSEQMMTDFIDNYFEKERIAFVKEKEKILADLKRYVKENQKDILKSMDELRATLNTATEIQSKLISLLVEAGILKKAPLLVVKKETLPTRDKAQ